MRDSSSNAPISNADIDTAVLEIDKVDGES